MHKKIKLNEAQIEKVVNIFSHAVHESTLHARKILTTGSNLFTRSGIRVTIGRAFKRRRRCMKVVKLALKGYMV